ncbi:hypothetical protein CVIRNUC_000105 [Coccomyxa viridis]|uniref:S-adenosyl-L-methionine-dependent methyltransferase n=1 Tax=Coccomyxa viridis TaxID=1274662 RepID=A0AAV1HT57_9CHLO|nr:hypothetical protein CVIRNUC_000105 [Coccomyxa viridis]
MATESRMEPEADAKLGAGPPGKDPELLLCQRPLNADLGKTNSNNDYIAPMFRDYLMPARHGAFLKLLYKLPLGNRVYRLCVERVVGAHGMINYVDARTAWMDDIVKQAQWQGIAQVVVLAAGYDTRCYRLKTGNTQFYEVDLPPVSEKKIKLVNAVIPDEKRFPRPIYAQADLAKTPLAKVLESNGFDPNKPALFTCEGLLCYLPQEAVDNLLAQVSQLAAPGSRLCFDALHRDHMDGRVKMRGYTNGANALAARGEPLLSSWETTPAGISDYFKPLDWQLVELLNPKDMVERRYKQKEWRQKRPPMLPFESYVLVEKAGKKVDAAAEPKAALQAPEQ